MTARGALERYPLTARIVAFAIVLEAFFIFMHGVNSAFFGDGFFFALDHDQSLPSWATGALFTLAGTTCGLLAWAERAIRMPLAALSFVGFALSLEQTAQLHGRIEETVDASKALEVVIGIAVIAVIVIAARALTQPYGLILLSAIGFMVISVLASQMNQSFEMAKVGIVFFQTIEEVCEMLTAFAIIAAVAEPLWGAIKRKAPPEVSEPRQTREPVAATPPPAR